MSTLLPPSLPFPPMMPSYAPPTPTTSVTRELPKTAATTTVHTPQTTSPLLSAASKSSEPEFTFSSNSSMAPQQMKHKEKYCCKYCGKVCILEYYQRF